MKLAKLSIENYRGIRSMEIPMSRFGCLIGENNSGKSSCLQALSLFFSGSKLSPENYFDASKHVRISVDFEDIDEADLSKLAEEHRQRVAGIVRNGKLTLVRIYDASGKGVLLYSVLMPNDERFSGDKLTELMKGQRAGQAFLGKVLAVFPELDGVVNGSMNQEVMKQKIMDLADSMPDDQKSISDQVLPTGIDRSIIPMLPDPIYIPAVKDLSDDVKTKESSPFGKILSILLQAVESKLPDAKELFERLNAKLNRIQQEDGTYRDDRLDEVRLIESTVEKYVKESFSGVALRIDIPPPELKTIFAGALIYANDGVDGLIDTKGDGLRRAIVFSILRSYVDLKARFTQKNDGEEVDGEKDVQPATGSYLLLFEEPELFLHPKAQQILFDALRIFSKDHHVIVTTHSPLFFGPEATCTFSKLSKVFNRQIAPKPFTKVQPIDLTEVGAKDQFQIICFENNNAAFFAETVVLVEGDSDYLLMPYLAKTLNAGWDVAKTPVIFVRITGKGNIRRYREFFSRFDVRVPVISDLDLLLDGFEHVSPNEQMKAVRSSLLQRVDALIVPEDEGDGASSREAKKAHESGKLRSLWRRVKEVRVKFAQGECSQQEHDDAVDEFFAWQRKTDRLSVLMNSDDGEMVGIKRKLLSLLRDVDVYVLERGAIEEYYPEGVIGDDKPSKAQDFCLKVRTRDEVLACCGEQPVEVDGKDVMAKEFDLIFGGIFKDK